MNKIFVEEGGVDFFMIETVNEEEIDRCCVYLYLF